MGICDNGLVGREAFRSLGEGGGAAVERVQAAEPRQHSMGVCEGGPVGLEVGCGIGQGGRVAD